MYRTYFIRWPTIDEVHQTEQFFYARNGFPGIGGVADGSHVEAEVSGEDREAYINRKKYPSVQL